MRKDEELIEAFNKQTEKSLIAANELCKVLAEFDDIELGEIETEEDEKKANAVLIERDRRKTLALRRILCEYGNLLFL